MITLPCPVCGERLEIPDGVSRFARAGCGSELEAQRSGEIVSLCEIKASPEAALARLQKELAKLMQQKMVDAPAYMLLRHNFFRLGKLHAWNLTFASESDLHDIFAGLKREELDRIIAYYQANPDSQMLAWLLKVRECRREIAELKQALRS